MGKIICYSMCINLIHIGQRQQCNKSEIAYRKELDRELSLAVAGTLQSIASSMTDHFVGTDDTGIGFPATIMLELEVDKWDLTVRATMEWPDDCDVLDGTGFENWQ